MYELKVDMILLKRRSYIPTLPSRHHDKIERTCAATPLPNSLVAGRLRDSQSIECCTIKPKKLHAPMRPPSVLFSLI